MNVFSVKNFMCTNISSITFFPVSGRSSSCSIIQEEGIIKRMCKTPRTPIKNCQVTPRKSDRKRSLFQSNSPTKSDDLGFMSPLSPSSSSSGQVCNLLLPDELQYDAVYS